MPCKMPLPIQDRKPKPKPGQKAPKARNTEKPENARTYRANNIHTPQSLTPFQYHVITIGHFLISTTGVP